MFLLSRFVEHDDILVFGKNTAEEHRLLRGVKSVDMGMCLIAGSRAKIVSETSRRMSHLSSEKYKIITDVQSCFPINGLVVAVNT